MKPQDRDDQPWLDQLRVLAKSTNLFLSDEEKADLTKAADDLIEFLTEFRGFISGLPDGRERESVSKSISVLLEFANKSRNNPAFASLFPKGASRHAPVKSQKPVAKPVDVEALVQELESLPTSRIEARLRDDKSLNVLELSILARRLGLATKSSDTRSQLIERIASAGFANRRGYDLLRHDKNP
ncbi:MAG: hypothetical protein JRN33_02975 [Nitrososphaerota archaeon]|jgi:hypothetical protein|nr:hypothetical protein [Nitrososphaerota archaeon]